MQMKVLELMNLVILLDYAMSMIELNGKLKIVLHSVLISFLQIAVRHLYARVGMPSWLDQVNSEVLRFPEFAQQTLTMILWATVLITTAVIINQIMILSFLR